MSELNDNFKRHEILFAMKSRSRFMLFAIAGLCLSCNKNSGTTPTGEPGFALPLAQGNTWQFRRTARDTSGAILDSSTVVMTVGERAQVSTETGYKLNRFPVLGFAMGGSPTIVWSNKTDGFYRIEGDDSVHYLWVAKILPYPTFAGDSANVAGQIVRVIAVHESVVVPAGSFSCIRYDVFFLSYPEIRGQIFVAPNVGIVKTWSPYGTSLRYEDELTSYQLH